MSRSQAKAQLGEATEETVDAITRAFESKRRMTNTEVRRLPSAAQLQIKAGELEPYFDVYVAVTVRFTGDSASEIEVWKSVTW